MFSLCHPPIMTVGHPATILPPCAVESPCRAAGCPPIITVVEPMAMLSGGPAQVHMFPTVAAGCPPIRTVGMPGGKIGPPVCGLPFGLAIGQTWLSEIRAAAGISTLLSTKYRLHVWQGCRAASQSINQHLRSFDGDHP